MPDAATEQLYVNASPFATEGPERPLPVKSDVTFTVMFPPPLALDVRTLYVNVVVPVNGLMKVVPVVASVVEFNTEIDASGPTVTANCVEPVVPKVCAIAICENSQAKASGANVRQTVRLPNGSVFLVIIGRSGSIGPLCYVALIVNWIVAA